MADSSADFLRSHAELISVIFSRWARVRLIPGRVSKSFGMGLESGRVGPGSADILGGDDGALK